MFPCLYEHFFGVGKLLHASLLSMAVGRRRCATQLHRERARARARERERARGRSRERERASEKERDYGLTKLGSKANQGAELATQKSSSLST
jgi:hypothetical protein